MVELDKIGEIKELNRWEDANALLAMGWKLITLRIEKQACYNRDEKTGKIVTFDKMSKIYILGRIR